MGSISDMLRGSDREYFDLFERAGANIVRAAELLAEMLVLVAGLADAGAGDHRLRAERRSAHP